MVTSSKGQEKWDKGPKTSQRTLGPTDRFLVLHRTTRQNTNTLPNITPAGQELHKGL